MITVVRHTNKALTLTGDFIERSSSSIFIVSCYTVFNKVRLRLPQSSDKKQYKSVYTYTYKQYQNGKQKLNITIITNHKNFLSLSQQH